MDSLERSLVILAIWMCIGGVLIGYNWYQYEEVYLSLSCDDLKYSIENKKPDTQMIWHYKDRCLG